MKTLFNDNWLFAEQALDEKTMFKDGKPVVFDPDDYFEKAAALSRPDPGRRRHVRWCAP